MAIPKDVVRWLKSRSWSSCELTLIDPIADEGSRGVSIEGLSWHESVEGMHFRWSVGSRTVLGFRSSPGRDLIFSLRLINTFPGQSVSVVVNGEPVESFCDLPSDASIQRRYLLRGRDQNQLVLEYGKTNRVLGFYPADARDLAAILCEFRVLYKASWVRWAVSGLGRLRRVGGRKKKALVRLSQLMMLAQHAVLFWRTKAALTRQPTGQSRFPYEDYSSYL